ncbi:MAG: ATP-binding protein [Halanaerobiaceae bacterium]
MIIKKNIYPLFYRFFVSVMGNIVSVIIMNDSVVYNGMRFDLRSAPIFLITYIHGWNFGLLSMVIPVLYRIHLGGPSIIEGIVFDILVIYIIGAIGHKKTDSGMKFINYNIRKGVLLYLIAFVIVYFMPFFWLSVPILEWIYIIGIFAICNIITIFLSIYLINDINRDMYRNIVEFFETKEELLEREQELKRKNLNVTFFSNISHEFKTPLNLILSALQMLNKYNEKKLKIEDDRFDRYLKIIKQNGYRLLRLVNNVIDITRIDVNSFELKLENHDIIKLVREIVCSVEEHILSRNKNLIINSNIESKVVAIDPENLERVLLNLISNAMKFTEPGDSIIVNIEERQDIIQIEVKDTGVGINKEKQEDVFKLFKQADESFSRRAEGSGIGLYIVKLIVELHDGKVWVESEKGVGSSFFIQLPIRKTNEEKSVKSIQDQSNELIDKIDIEFSDIYSS